MSHCRWVNSFLYFLACSLCAPCDLCALIPMWRWQSFMTNYGCQPFLLTYIQLLQLLLISAVSNVSLHASTNLRPTFVNALFPVTCPHHIYSTVLVIIIVLEIYLVSSWKIPEVSENVPYTWNFSRYVNFTNFAVSRAAVKIYPVKILPPRII